MCKASCAVRAQVPGGEEGALRLEKWQRAEGGGLDGLDFHLEAVGSH